MTRSLMIKLCATLVALAAMLLLAAQAHTPLTKVFEQAGPSISDGARHHVVAVVPRRSDSQVRRDRGWLDDVLPLLSLASAAPRQLAQYRPAGALGAGYVAPRDRSISQFRKRIPRMNSEDPPRA